MGVILNFFTDYCIHLMITVAILVAMWMSKGISPKTKILFSVILTLNVLYLISTYIDTSVEASVFSVSFFPLHCRVRHMAVGVSYALKTPILTLLVIGVYRMKKKQALLYFLPCLVSTLLSVLSLPFDLVYRISPANIYIDGPCKGVYVVIGFAYLASLPFCELLFGKKRSVLRLTSVFLIFLLIVTAVIRGLLFVDRNNALAMSIIVSMLVFFLFQFLEDNNRIIEEKTKKIERQETNLLVSQIQPHFFTNTLNVACELCREDPDKAETVLINFSRYLRNNLDFSTLEDPLIPIETEIRHARFYSNIEQVRFNKLTVEYDIQDSGYLLPFLTVQPMVENAIRHGVRGLDNGCVTVRLWKETGESGKVLHKISIADNGTGVSLIGNHTGEHKSIGIDNVRSRVEIIAGGTFDIRFTPTGTTVTITIPE